jgi:uncharacterized membrane protein
MAGAEAPATTPNPIMKENVGSNDRTLRSIVGPALILIGYTFMGGYRGRLKGLLTMMAGTAVADSAITRVCPLSAVLGIDSRDPWEQVRDRSEAFLGVVE